MPKFKVLVKKCVTYERRFEFDAPDLRTAQVRAALAAQELENEGRKVGDVSGQTSWQAVKEPK